MECVELAPAFEPPHTSDSGSKLHAFHTLRETDRRCPPPMQFVSYPPENLRKKTRFSDILFSAPGCGLGARLRWPGDRRAQELVEQLKKIASEGGVSRSMIRKTLSIFHFGCDDFSIKPCSKVDP